MPNTVIALKKSATPSAAPADLANGELAINYADGKIFYKNTAGYIAQISGGNFFGTVNANSTLLVADSPGDIVTVLPGNNITITGDAVNDRFTVALKDNVSVSGSLNVAGDFNHTGGTFYINNMSGAGGSSEGGEIKLANSTSATQILSGPVSIDIYENKLRFFETNSPNRGAFINLAAASATVGTDLLATSSSTDNAARASASAAFDKANAANVLAFNALPNTTGATFNGNLIASQNISADKIISTNNGIGENFKVGDDAWIGDTNLANALRIKGQQNASIGYVIFGPNDGKLLGRSGTDNLTYDGNVLWHAGNDGIASGLDADLLDGQHGSYYSPVSLANSAYDKANAANSLAYAALPNTSGVSFVGNLNFPSGNIGIGTTTNVPLTVAAKPLGPNVAIRLVSDTTPGSYYAELRKNDGTTTFYSSDDMNLRTPYRITYSSGGGGWSGPHAFNTLNNMTYAADGSGTQFITFSGTFQPITGNGWYRHFYINPTINQAANTLGDYTMIHGYVIESAARGANNRLIDMGIGSTRKFAVSNTGSAYFADNVGIGTTTTGQKLDVRGWGRFGLPGNDAGIEFENGYGKIYRATSSGNIVIDPQVNVIIPTGSVGIGTVTPSYKLHVNTSSGTIAQFTGGTDSGVIFGSGGLTGFTDAAGNNGFIFNTTGNYSYIQTNGSEKVRVTSTGRMGIGNTNPQATLEVDGWQQLNGGGAQLCLFPSGDSTYIGTATSHNLTIRTGSSDRITVTSAGLVGISNTNPQALLHVSGTGPQVRWDNPSAADARHEYYRNNTRQGYLNWDADLITLAATQANGNITFATGGTTERVRIDNTGKVGLGAAVPLARLHVRAPSGGISTIRFDDAIAPRNNYIGVDNYEQITIAADDDGTAGATPNIKFRLGGVERVRVTNTGRVGIGTTNPSAKFDVSSGHVRIDDAFSYYWGTGSASINGSSASNFIDFYTNGLFKARLDSNGNLGIGNTAPTYKLHVDGGDAFVRNTTSAGKVYFPTNGIVPYIGTAANQMYIEYGSYNLFFTRAGGTNVMTLGAGNVGIGNTNPQAPLHVSKSGAGETLRLEDATSPYATYYVGGVRKGWFGFGYGITDYEFSNESTGNIIFRTSTSGSTPLNNVRMTITNTGNVGVGTSSPSAPLQVFGEIKSNTLTVFGTIAGYNANLSGVYPNVTDTCDVGSSTAKWRDLWLSRTALIGSNVGIGTTSPNTQLHIKGSTASGAYLTLEHDSVLKFPGIIFNSFGGAAGDLSYIVADTRRTTGDFGSALHGLIYKSGRATLGNHSFLNSSNTVTMVIKEDGNTGIGTTTPSYKLDISGSANASDFFVNGQSIINTLNGANAIAIAAYTNANSKFSSSGGTITGDVNIIGNLILSGNTMFANVDTMSVRDPLIYLAANNYSADIVDIGFIGNYVNATGQNVHTGIIRDSVSKEYYVFYGYDKEPVNNHIDPSGNNFTLAVLNSNIRTSNLILGGTNAISWIANAYDKANAANSLAYAALPNTSGSSFAGNLNFPTGNVGIGLSNPTSNLHVFGTANITSNLSLGASLSFGSRIGSSANDLSKHIDMWGGIYGFNITSFTLNAITDPAGNVTFRTGATERGRVNSYGLIVTGNTSVTGNSVVSGSTLLTGKVGIATTNPAYNLEVNGTAWFSSARAQDAYVGTMYLGYGVASGTISSDASGKDITIQTRSDGAKIFLSNTTNNVGIGTTSPAYKLEVAGSFAAQTKSFVINHPTKPDMKLRYGSLEGPENGVYVRGRVQGSYIYLPDYWKELVDENSVTVSLTPIGQTKMPSVLSWNNQKIVLDNTDQIDCFYHIYGERKDVEKLVVEF